MTNINCLLSQLNEVETKRSALMLQLYAALVGNDFNKSIELYNEIDDAAAFIRELSVHIEESSSMN